MPVKKPPKDLDPVVRVAKLFRKNAMKRPQKGVRFKIDAEDWPILSARMASEGMTISVLIEAVMKGYIDNDPGVMSAIDNWKTSRASYMHGERPRLFKRRTEVDDIYDMISETK